MKIIFLFLMLLPQLCFAASRVVILDPDTGRTVPVDSEVPAIVTITEEHHHAHTGKQFRANVTFESLANGTTGYVLIKTTTTADMHLHISYNVGGNFFIHLTSAPVVTNIISTATAANLNQEVFSLTTSSATIHKVAVSSIGAYVIDKSFVEGGSGPQSTGSSVAGAIEWILNSGLEYLISCENISGGAKTITVILQWYEVS